MRFMGGMRVFHLQITGVGFRGSRTLTHSQRHYNTVSSGVSRLRAALADPPTLNDVKPLKVMISGGGISGMTLANGLVNQGADVHVFEKSDSFRPSGGPILIQSNAMASIEAMNKSLADELKSIGVLNSNRVNGEGCS